MAYKKSGVPKGYVHNWRYLGRWKEKKVGKGTWKGTFTATKGRKVRGYHRNQPSVGDKILWSIKGIQSARKTSAGTYQTRFNFIKKLIKMNRKKKFKGYR